MPLSLMKPKSVGTTQNPTSSSVIGRSGTVFKIKVGSYVIAGDVPIDDVTGDGDDGYVPCDGTPRTRITLLGWLIGGSEVGFANLGNGGGLLELLLSSTRKITATVIPAGYQANWARRRGCVPVSLSAICEGLPVEGTHSV